MSQFIEDLVRPHVMDTSLDDGYQAMAADMERETEGNGATPLLEIWPMKRGRVWWVEFDPAVGSEIHKTCPAAIVSDDAANRNLARVVVVPLTSNQ